MSALDLVHTHRLPAGPGPHPAVVTVHGWLGNEKVMSIFDRTLPPTFAVISVRAPEEIRPDSYGWYRHDDVPEGFRRGLATLRAFVTALPTAYPLDPARLYLQGFSQGAAMSLSLLLSDPALVAGVAALAGFLPAQAAEWATPGKLAGKPVFMAHGTQDETVPVTQAQEARQALEQAGATITYREYPIGHKLNAQGMNDLKTWWTEQNRV